MAFPSWRHSDVICRSRSMAAALAVPSRSPLLWLLNLLNSISDRLRFVQPKYFLKLTFSNMRKKLSVGEHKLLIFLLFKPHVFKKAVYFCGALYLLSFSFKFQLMHARYLLSYAFWVTFIILIVLQNVEQCASLLSVGGTLEVHDMATLWKPPTLQQQLTIEGEYATLPFPPLCDWCRKWPH